MTAVTLHIDVLIEQLAERVLNLVDLVGALSLRSVRERLTKALTVKTAARVHSVPLEEFLDILHRAAREKSASEPVARN